MRRVSVTLPLFWLWLLAVGFLVGHFVIGPWLWR